MKVDFGISLGSSVGLLGGADTQKFMDLVKMADGYGATAIGTYDSAFLVLTVSSGDGRVSSTPKRPSGGHCRSRVKSIGATGWRGVSSSALATTPPP